MAEKGTLFGKPRDEVVKHPGSLRAELHAKPGKNIPEASLKKAEHSKNPKERKRAHLAETFAKMRNMKH
jgi:hypothetical protein